MTVLPQQAAASTMMVSAMMSLLLVLFLAQTIVLPVTALDNGLGRTPQMGWNSWNHYHCNINEEIIRNTADAMSSNGLKELGYIYVNVDDCWAVSRNEQGVIQADNATFPSGMAALASYAHSKGLKFDAGTETCAGRPGSLGHEVIDAATYAEWQVDYLKYDNCHNEDQPPKARYTTMRDALNKTNRAIFYSMCEWGQDFPAMWAADIGNSWRTSMDIQDVWVSVLHNLDVANVWHKDAGPGGWNDPDMLMVGNGGLSFVEERSHFSLWSIMKAPLLIGCDVTNMTASTKLILMNQEVIAINQDPLGVQGYRVKGDPMLGEGEVFAAPLSDHSFAVVLFNRHDNSKDVTLDWSDLDVKDSDSLKVRDLWTRQDVGTYTSRYSKSIAAHDCVMLRLYPTATTY